MERTAVQLVDRVAGGAVEEITTAEVSQQIRTAKAYPRDVPAARKEAREIATMSEEIAGECMYALPRKEKGKTKTIEGPSVRFADVLVYCWGNMRAGSRIVDEGREFITAQGFCYDLQRNNGIAIEVKRKISSDRGRFSSDMIAMTANAACSIAFRNAVFDIIPKPLYWDIYQAARSAAIGDIRSLRARADAAIAHFIKSGAEEAKIYTALGVEDKSAITLDHLAILRGLAQAVKEGEITIDQAFDPAATAERDRLNLRDDSDDPANPNVPGTPIDGLLGKDKAKPPADKPGKEKGGAPAKEAAQAGDGGGPSEKQPDDAETKPAGGAAGSAQADDGEPDSDADLVDRDLLAEIEPKLNTTKAHSSRKAVNEHREALDRIATTGRPDLKARAAKILQDWPAK